MRQFAAALQAAGYRLCAAGAGYQGEYNPQGFPVLPATRDRFEPAIREAVRRWSPRLILTVGEPWMFDEVPWLRRELDLRWVACFPVDATPLPAAWATWIRSADATAVFSRYGQRVVRESMGLEPEFLPHGVDVTTFCPLDKPLCKRRVGVEGHFVVGSVAVNQARKNLPALVRSFADFARDKSDVLLYLHTRIDQSLEQVIASCGVTERTRATLNYLPHRGLSDADLATVYNSFEVFVLPTMAEGFGLPILESQACGIPALATDCSACSELLPDPLQRLPVARRVVHNGFEQSAVDQAILATRLDQLYSNDTLRTRLATESLEFARTKQWPPVLAQLARLVASAIQVSM